MPQFRRDTDTGRGGDPGDTTVVDAVETANAAVVEAVESNTHELNELKERTLKLARVGELILGQEVEPIEE